MAHVKHYTAPSVRGMLAHNKRTENYSNPDIDPSRSKYNYSLSGHDDDYSYYEKRLSEVHHMKRANLNTLSSWVITLPKGIKREDQKQFFLECKNFLDERYGEKNCVSADVHFDETTPHIHYTFIPVVHDLKKDREKVSCKELFRLKELYSFHDDLEKYVTARLGYSVGIRTGKTEKNVSIRELKNTTKAEILENAQQIADKCVTDAVKEAANIKERAEEEKRKYDDFYAKKASVVLHNAEQIANKYVTDAVKEASSIKEKAEEEKRKIDDFYEEKMVIMRRYELTEEQSKKVYDEQFALQEKKKRVLFNRVWVDKDLYETLLHGAPHRRTLEQMKDWLEEYTTQHNAAAHREKMQKYVIDSQQARIERLEKEKAEQQEILERNGLKPKPVQQKRKGKSI